MKVHGITDADREAARLLREHLADLSGFWHLEGDDGPLCQALARHRIDAEQRLAEKLAPFLAPSLPGKGEPESEEVSAVFHPETVMLPRHFGSVRKPAQRRSRS